MRPRRTLTPAAIFLSLACGSCNGSPDGVTVNLPNGSPGIGFDDLRYSATLQRVLAPAGRTGALDLVDPGTLTVGAIAGFSATDSYDGSHDFGATSVDEGGGLLFVTDRTSFQLDVVDPNIGTVVARTQLGASPDYVRYVAATNEVWVSEPSAGRIEIFSAGLSPAPAVNSAGTIAVNNGPESLVIDQQAGRAYTHRWQSSTVVIDVRTRSVIGEWQNGCAASRGLAVDERRGFFYVACNEGTVAVLDAGHNGRLLSSLARGSGYDVIGYAPVLGHLYLAGTSCSCLVVLGVSQIGELSFLGRFGATSSAHCATADERGHVWVCDPDGGRLLRIDDPYPASW